MIAATRRPQRGAMSVTSRNAVSDDSSRGTSPGSETSVPGTSSSACPGGYLEASTGVTSTWYCSKNSGSGGAGAAQCPEAKMRDCSR